MDSEEDVCCICGKVSDSEDKQVKLTSRGADGVNRASEGRGKPLVVSAGQHLHEQCRKRYCSRKEIDQDVGNAKRKSEEPQIAIQTPSRRSQYYFDYRDHCFLCGQRVNLEQRKNLDDDVYSVRSFDFQTIILSACDERNDEWSDVARGRIESVVDLHDADAIYHKVCNGNFRTGKKYRTDSIRDHRSKRVAVVDHVMMRGNVRSSLL